MTTLTNSVSRWNASEAKDNLLILGGTGSGKTVLARQIVSSRIAENSRTRILWCDPLAEAPLDLGVPEEQVLPLSNRSEIEFTLSQARERLPQEPVLIVLEEINSLDLSDSCWEDIHYLLVTKKANFIFTSQSPRFSELVLLRSLDQN